MHGLPAPDIARLKREPSFTEFVGLIALMMGVGAFAVDNLLPAFPAMADALQVTDHNRMQLVVYVYMLGFALPQLIYGPASDIFGRKPVLMVGLTIFLVGCGMAVFATDLNALLIARFIQGSGVAATRVLSIAIVRDRFAGREMARVMSLAIVTFIMVPVFAPSVGSMLLLLGGWKIIFAAMVLIGLILAGWFGLRMPETLRPEYRRDFSAGDILGGFRRTIATRASLGYATAFGLSFGCVMSYVGSSEQIFGSTVYGLGPLFPVVFGAIAAAMGAAALLNSRLVVRFGMRRISHAGLLALLCLSAVQVVVALLSGGRPPLLVFGTLLGMSQFFVMLVMPNFNTMAMEPQGAIAGTASSIIGFYTTLVGTFLGMVVGHFFNGTVIPLAFGYLALSGTAILVVLWTEGGVLFRPSNPDPVQRRAG
jgi:DHA1 family bicyclomycin/chloramphenicol resistance-like MFS transporter